MELVELVESPELSKLNLPHFTPGRVLPVEKKILFGCSVRTPEGIVRLPRAAYTPYDGLLKPLIIRFLRQDNLL